MDAMAFSVDNLAAPGIERAAWPDAGAGARQRNAMGKDLKSYFQYFPISERDRKWGLYVTTAGEARIGPHVPYPPPGHPKGYNFEWRRGRVLADHQVVYISRGRGWFETRHTARQRIESGTVILIFPGVWHRYMPDSKTGWDEHWIGFDGDIARRWVKNGFLSKRKPVWRPGYEDVLLTLFAGLFEAIKANRPALQQIMAGTATQILGLLYSAQHARLAGDDTAMSAVQSAIVRMQTALESRLDMQTLARQLNVSYRWFRRTFAQHTGLSPHHYLLELRLARARSLLSETTAPVKEVATHAGFEDEHYFCRAFKQKIGLTPTQWRARSRNSE
jgi:AraC-like DNA-binding protein